MRRKPFRNEQAALSVIYALRARDQDADGLEPFLCATCGKWHLRRRPKFVMPSPPLRTWIPD